MYQKTPDGGESRFAYDRLGRLVVSQNAKQESNNRYSYSKYDYLGRVVEAGEMALSNHQIDGQGRLINVGTTLPADVNTGYFPSNLAPIFRYEITQSIYTDLANISAKINPTQTAQIRSLFGSEYRSQNTRNRIVGVIYKPTLIAQQGTPTYTSGTFYDYDVHGNVAQMIQVNHDEELIELHQTYKQIKYEYDLVSGNVNEVVYQPGKVDQFIHKYTYDADNRITLTETSDDGFFFEQDAKYFYYDHGPLARTEIGHKKVQAQDYAYTIQGWIKVVNGEDVNPTTMMGRDGNTATSNLNSQVARDAFGYSLNYFDNDYSSANTSMLNYSNTSDNKTLGLFNGNIRGMFTALSDLNEQALFTHETVYQYDQLNRIKAMDGFEAGTTTISKYASSYSYDKNGNIKTMQRSAPLNGNGAQTLMDDFSYNYYTSTDATYDPTSSNLTEQEKRIRTNKLAYVIDNASSSNFDVDIDDQSLLINSNPNANLTDSKNYAYDTIGQLIKDVDEGISSISWKVTNKIGKIEYTNGKHILFDYDAMGNRIAKKVYTSANDETPDATYYVLDAQGNQMAMYKNGYELQMPGSSDDGKRIFLEERAIFGSSRLGLENPHIRVDRQTPNNYSIKNHYIGDKSFELANHLGNVLNVVTDRKLAVSDGEPIPSVAYYTADVTNFSDYDPFGMQLVGRHESEESYRYGFQGQESDNEIKGEGNSVNYSFRMHDPRIGRFFAVDPLAAKYPHYTPYSFSGNKVIAWRELEGLEEYYSATGEFLGKEGTSTEIRIVHESFIESAKTLNSTEFTLSEGDKLNLYQNGSHGVFKNNDEAAMDWGKRVNEKSIKDKKEYGSTLYEIDVKGNKYITYTEEKSGFEKSVDPAEDSPNPSGTQKTGYIHSHGNYDPELEINNDIFSLDDRLYSIENKVGTLYVSTPNGTLQKYNTKEATIELLSKDLKKDDNDKFPVENEFFQKYLNTNKSKTKENEE